MTDPARTVYQVPPSSTPLEAVKQESLHPPTSEGGISNTRFAKLCGTGKNQLRKIRDNPEKLAAFTVERLGKPYRYRDGQFYPVQSTHE